MLRRAIPLLLAALAAAASGSATPPPVHHQLAVRLEPASHRIQVIDRITVGKAIATDSEGALRFVLHAGLSPRVVTAGWRLVPAEGPPPADFLGINATSETAGDVPLAGYRLIPGDGATEPVELQYGGEIHHPLATSGEEYQRSFSETPGLIDERGVFLSGTSFWLPRFGDGLITFDLRVDGLTPPWDAVSQGARVRHEVGSDGRRSTAWSCTHPQEEAYLVAGPWHEYEARAGKVALFAFLREDDPGLADRYLKATRRYLKLYEGLLPGYPYASFALVENFWETGYGMPGFTLLGPRVIRFPWILTSSYPHELLHNWWGNSAYVDFASGNWCEGLTAYMADHLFAEQRGQGTTYRRATLKKFSDFVTGGADFPLSEFHNRFSAASEAVGYGKSLMLFHMARRSVGDAAFVEALGTFYAQHRFRRGGFADLAAALESTAGGHWRRFFEAWTTRTGAPRIEVASVHADPAADATDAWKVRLELRQAQPEAPYPVTIPVAVTVEGAGDPVWSEVPCERRKCSAVIDCPSRPLRLDVDPAFDVMRRLDPLEVPPALSTLFGASAPTFVLPSSASAAELAGWRELATQWAKPKEPVVVLDSEIDEPPAGSAWILGWANRFCPAVAEKLAIQGVRLSGDTVKLDDETYGAGESSVVLVARGKAPDAAVGWVTAAPAEAISGLARKLPHYTRYSYLAFRGTAPDNVAKGMWRPLGSPMVRNLTDGPLAELHLPPRKPLAELPPAFEADSMRRAVELLASPDLEGRGLGTPGLDRATTWVEGELRNAGLEPAGAVGYRSSWSWAGGEPRREMTLTNLVGRVPGSDPKLAGHPVLVTAHIDHLGRGWPDVRTGNEGKIHPGADDNASGVAVLLALAKTMAAAPPRPRPVLFAVVTGEEAGLLGSRHLLAELPANGLPFACVNLDTVGRLADGKLYILNADSAREWRFIWMGVGYTTGAPVAVVAEPLDASDQVACLERGVPAVQLFSGPTADYHRPSDTADKIDAEGMAVVAEAAHEAATYLAERTEPLTVTINGAPPAESSRPAAPRRGRRVSLGTVPDFAFAGPGVRVDQVVPGSPAEAAGIRAGDVVAALDGDEISDLRSYSKLLKAHAPGDEVTVTVLRNGKKVALKARLAAR